MIISIITGDSNKNERWYELRYSNMIFDDVRLMIHKWYDNFIDTYVF